MIFRAAAAALLVLGATSARADEASEAMVRDFIAWIDSAPDWSATVASVHSEGRDTFAEGVVFSRPKLDVSVSIEALRLRDLIETPDGEFVASQVEIAGVAIVSEVFRYAVPELTVDAVTLPTTEGINFDPHHVMTFLAQTYSAMAKAEFSNLRIPQITAVSEADPNASVRIEYRNITSIGMGNGVMENVDAGPVIVRGTGPDGEYAFDIEKVSSGRSDLGAIAHIFNPQEYAEGRGDGVWRPIFSSAAYSGVSGTGPDGFALRLDSMAMEGVEGRQLDKPFTAIWDRLLDMSVPDDEKADLALDLVRSYSAWRLGTFRMNGLSIEVPAESTVVSLADLTVSGVSSDGVDSLIMNDARVGAPDGFFTLGTLEVGGFVSPDITALMRFGALEADIDPKMHADIILQTLAALPRISHFGMHNLAGGQSKAQAVRLDSFTLDFRDWNDIFAGETDMRLVDLHIPRALMDLDPGVSTMLDTLGYQDITLGMSLSDRWSPTEGIDDAVWKIAVRDAGDLALSYTLTGLTAEWLIDATAAAARGDDSQDAVMAMLADLRLASAVLSVTDRSLLDRGFAVAAQQQGLDVDGPTYREQMRAALPFILSAAIPPDLVNLLTKPLQDFLAGGQTLIANIGPNPPIAVPDLIAAAEANPMALPKLLNLTLTSRPRE